MSLNETEVKNKKMLISQNLKYVLPQKLVSFVEGESLLWCQAQAAHSGYDPNYII